MQEFPPDEPQNSDFMPADLTAQDAPTVPQTQPAFAQQGKPWLIVGMLGGLAVVLAFTLFLTAHHALAQGNVAGVAAAGTATTTPGRGHRWPGGPGGMGKHGPFVAVTITAISGQTITGTSANGATATIKVTASTVYHREDKTIALSDLSKGTVIMAIGTTNSDGSLTATQIVVRVPTVAGTVTAVSGTTITVQDRAGTSQTIKTTGSTTFQKGSQTGSVADVSKGENVAAAGMKNSDGSLTADIVSIQVPHSGGKITQISGSTITVQSPRGTDTIQVSSSTTYVNAQTKAAISLSTLKVGDFIVAEGTPNSSNVFVATTVYLVPAGSGPSGFGPHAGSSGFGPHAGPGLENGTPVAAPGF